MNPYIDLVNSVGREFFSSLLGNMVINLLILFGVGKAMKIEKMTLFTSLLIVLVGNGSFFILANSSIRIPIFGSNTPILMSLVLVLVCLVTTLDIEMGRAIALLCVYAVVFGFFVYVGWFRPESALLPFMPVLSWPR